MSATQATSPRTLAVDETRLNAFMGDFVGDLGAVMHAATIVVGDKLGLYKALADSPLTAEALAQRTETDPRYVREWLSAQAASGYVEYDPKTERFSLSDEQAFALTVEGGPAFIPGAFQIAVAQFKAIPKMVSAFRTGLGLGWHEHDSALFHGTERFFRPGYAANLVSQWIPACDGWTTSSTAGATVADVGCGHGASTLIMAKAFPTLDLRRLRLPRAVGRAGDAGCRARRLGRRACASKSPAQRTFPGAATTW